MTSGELRPARAVVIAVGSLAAALAAAGARADCIDDAARHHGVNTYALRAIGWHESGLRPDAEHVNENRTVDIGAFQMNSSHLGALARYGIGARALKNGCVAAYVAAWHYKQQVMELGNTWAAVGAYHSHTPARQAWYANQIAQVLMRWKVLPTGRLPYVGVPLLAPGQANATAPAQRRSTGWDSAVTLFDGQKGASTSAQSAAASKQ